MERDAEVAAEALGGQVDGRAGALAEDLGQDRELQQADAAPPAPWRRPACARSTSPASGHTRRSSAVVSAITLRSVRANTVARDTSSWERSAMLILSAAAASHTPAAAALSSRRAARMPAGRLCLYYRAKEPPPESIGRSAREALPAQCTYGGRR